MSGGQHILILMHFKVCSYVSPCGVLCLCFLRGGVLVCILEHISICLTQCLPTGAVQVQQLIDTGALVTWTEANGREMVGATTEVGGATTQKISFGGSREQCQQCQGNWGESAESYEEDESYESDESYEGLRMKETYESDESYES